MQNYHRLFWASQERYDKLVNLSSSGGAAGFSAVAHSGGSDSVFEVANALAELTRNGVHKNGESETPLQVDSGIDIGGNLSSSDGSHSDQNGGSFSPTFSRRQRKESKTLKPVVDRSSVKVSSDKTPNNRDKEKPPTSNKTGVEKVPGNRTFVEKSSVNFGASSSHAFAVPKPPGPRKGVRRPLHVEFAPATKAATSSSTGPAAAVAPLATTTVVTASDDVTSATKRSQSRLVMLVLRTASQRFPFRSGLLVPTHDLYSCVTLPSDFCLTQSALRFIYLFIYLSTRVECLSRALVSHTCTQRGPMFFSSVVDS